MKWATLSTGHNVDYGHVKREVRMSSGGIVVVEDELEDGSFRHQRVTPDGYIAVTYGRTSREAYMKARAEIKRQREEMQREEAA